MYCAKIKLILAKGIKMAKEIKVDIKENRILAWDSTLLNILLKDNSSGKNIIWATDDYTQYDATYTKDRQITVFSVTGKNGTIIKPRVEKTKQEQLFDFGVNFSGLKKLFISSSALQTNYMYAFEYLSQNDISRLGCVIFNRDAKPEQILLQTQDFEGGIHNPFIFRNNFFYTTMDENDFKVFSVPFQNIKLDY